MSSSAYTSSLRATRHGVQSSGEVDAAMIETQRAIASAIAPLVAGLQEGAVCKRPIEATRRLMMLQEAAATARVALEQRFSDLKNAEHRESSSSSGSAPTYVPLWAARVHETLCALENRIRQGYRNQEDPVQVRNAVIRSHSGSAPRLFVPPTIIGSSAVSNFDENSTRNSNYRQSYSNSLHLPSSSRVVKSGSVVSI
ncbi:MAG: hypothetical protein RIS36_174 [Pseudomonadota bacterium]|jgi:hypothetical protein